MVDDPVIAYILILSVMSVLYIYIHIYLSHCNHNYNVQINFHYIYIHRPQKIHYIISHQYPTNIKLIRWFSPCLTIPNIVPQYRSPISWCLPKKRRPELSFKRSRGQRRSSLGLPPLGQGRASVKSRWCSVVRAVGGVWVVPMVVLVSQRCSNWHQIRKPNSKSGLKPHIQHIGHSVWGDPTFGRDPAWFLLHRSAQSDSKFSTPTDFNTRRAGTAQTAHGPARQTHTHSGNSCSKRS